MKRLILLGLMLLVVGATGAFVFFGRSMFPIQTATNFDPRPLTQQEYASFLGLVCNGGSDLNSHPSDYDVSYQNRCKNLIDYPDPQASLPGPDDLTLDDIIYGHVTAPDLQQAYVSYSGSFEPHSNGWGGGILFQKKLSVWRLVSWFPGGQADNCLMLEPNGQAKMLCLLSYLGEGDLDTWIFIMTFSIADQRHGGSPQYSEPVLEADDVRDTLYPNDNCQELTKPDQDILFSIDNLRRSTQPNIFAEATIQYIASHTASAACKSGDLENVKTLSGVVKLKWDGKVVTMEPDYNFAPVPKYW